MTQPKTLSPEEIDRHYAKLKAEAESGGYYLNPDVPFTKDLVASLLVTEARYGYPACPCRLADGQKPADLDIICPCDYRDADLVDYDACYCGLYVSQRALKGQAKIGSIPERRPPRGERQKAEASPDQALQPEPRLGKLPLPVWRCKVCGYLCARENPPEICPICKVKKDRFERFI